MAGQRAEVTGVGLFEAKAFDILDHLLHAARHRVPARKRILAKEEVEDGVVPVPSRPPVSERHRELVQVGQECQRLPVERVERHSDLLGVLPVSR